MKVILTKDVRKLGKAGEAINVSDGFARNFLLPQKMALIADRQVQERLIREQVSREDASRRARESVTGFFDHLRKQPLEFDLPGDAEGHLYAGLKESEILAKISKGGDITQKSLNLEAYVPLKKAGSYEIVVRGPYEFSAKLKISITCKS